MRGTTVRFIQALPDGTEVTVEALGKSMSPTIRRGEHVGVVRCSIGLVCPGDVIALVIPGTGTMAIHRVVMRRLYRGRSILVTRGDANSRRDPGVVDENNFLGKAVWVKRGKRRCRLASHQQSGFQVFADKLIDVSRTLLARFVVERG